MTYNAKTDPLDDAALAAAARRLAAAWREHQHESQRAREPVAEALRRAAFWLLAQDRRGVPITAATEQALAWIAGLSTSVRRFSRWLFGAPATDRYEATPAQFPDAAVIADDWASTVEAATRKLRPYAKPGAYEKHFGGPIRQHDAQDERRPTDPALALCRKWKEESEPLSAEALDRLRKKREALKARLARRAAMPTTHPRDRRRFDGDPHVDRPASQADATDDQKAIE